MNVGIMQASAIPKKVPTRPRSPEGKASATRTRSPITGKTQGIERERERTSVVRPVDVPLGPGRPSQQQPAVKRVTSSTVEEIKRIDMNRESRRKAAEEVRRSRQEEMALLGAQCGGAVPDIDFHRMIRDYRSQCQAPLHLRAMDPEDSETIMVCVRKRPLQNHEVANRELDCVTAVNPYAIIHEQKFKVDGITKCLESHQFEFDRVFDENCSTEDVYRTVAQPLVPWAIERGGRATLFAYGQTGSGKTHTMVGIQRQLADQIFESVKYHAEPLVVSVSFFEIYGGWPYDLLNNRQRLETLEDSRNEVQIAGLVERAAASPDQLLQCIELGNSLRTTHATAINRDSSRSHAICSVFLRPQAVEHNIHSKVVLVDLAGSERAADSKSTIRQRRVEGAQINKSLLALKECIRAMGDTREAHVPFRASKLTLVLRDAFVSRCPSKTVMIACISPGAPSADHSVNTLRYSDRLKDHPRAARPTNSEAVADARSRGSATRDGAKSPDPHGPRRRSPSPVAEPAQTAGGYPSPKRMSRNVSPLAPDFPKMSSSGGVPVVGPKDHDTSGGPLPQELDCGDMPLMPAVSWNEGGGGVAADTLPSDHSRIANSSNGVGSALGGSRQPVSRRGRQPTLKPREVGEPSRREVVNIRAQAPASSLDGSASSFQVAGRGSGNVAVMGGGGAAVAGGGISSERVSAAAAAQAHAAHAAHDREDGSPVRGERSAEPPLNRSSDLLQQDNRYLHNTLTSEVFERVKYDVPMSGVVDVGVEDLADLAHMEALDEVRQWQDRIVSQHMVALQEDAKLLTAESELLSHVQQDASNDIDRYVHEAEKVVRRKMEVYRGFLEELEVFKDQLRREERLSMSCQRGRQHVPAEPLSASVGVQQQPPQAQHQHQHQQLVPGAAVGGVAGHSSLDGAPQRTPRTPRLTSPAGMASLTPGM